MQSFLPNNPIKVQQNYVVCGSFAPYTDFFMLNIKRTALILEYFATSPDIFPLSTPNLFREGVHAQQEYDEFKKVFERRANKLNESAPDWGKFSKKLKGKKYNVHFYAKWIKETLTSVAEPHALFNAHALELSRQIQEYAKKATGEHDSQTLVHSQSSAPEHQLNIKSLLEKTPADTSAKRFLQAYFNIFTETLQANISIKPQTIAFLLRIHIAGIFKINIEFRAKPTDEAKQKDWALEREYEMTVLRIIAKGVEAYYEEQLTPSLQDSHSNSDPVLCSAVTRVTNPLYQPTNKTINPSFQRKAQDDAADASPAMQRLCLSPRNPSTNDSDDRLMRRTDTPRLQRSRVVSVSTVDGVRTIQASSGRHGGRPLQYRYD